MAGPHHPRGSTIPTAKGPRGALMGRAAGQTILQALRGSSLWQRKRAAPLPHLGWDNRKPWEDAIFPLPAPFALGASELQEAQTPAHEASWETRESRVSAAAGAKVRWALGADSIAENSGLSGPTRPP